MCVATCSQPIITVLDVLLPHKASYPIHPAVVHRVYITLGKFSLKTAIIFGVIQAEITHGLSQEKSADIWLSSGTETMWLNLGKHQGRSVKVMHKTWYHAGWQLSVTATKCTSWMCSAWKRAWYGELAVMWHHSTNVKQGVIFWIGKFTAVLTTNKADALFLDEMLVEYSTS